MTSSSRLTGILSSSAFLLLLIALLLAASVTIQPGQEYFAWMLLIFFFLFSLVIKPKHLFIRVTFFSFGAFITLRYILFRAFYTLYTNDTLSFVLTMLLFIAECYAILIHFGGLFVSLYPKDRETPPLPKDLPTIDVLIPTYNENISVALTTALACKNFEYPEHLVRVYILDDGSRLPRLNTTELQAQLLERHRTLKQKAKEIGAIYLTREDGKMAKAGMLNAAFNGMAFSDLKQDAAGVYQPGERIKTEGDIILILDCDHVPSRDMLTRTIGHFTDQRVFLVQTPHFMLNPDPMRKNFGDEKKFPCESWLFYSDVQKGLDRWNSAFFCGSAALLRRKMLAENHGLSGDTITEDCETALSLHAKGYRSVYVNTPLIAGLAPESFIDMIKQRQRWCQGMVQILLLKTPLFQRGLTLAQRLCYMNSCLFWIFPLVRLAFMLSPLVFLLFSINIYNASIPQVLAYALPHLLSSSFLSATIHGKVRPFLHSEVLETLQSFFLLPAIIAVILSPRKPTFVTTRKGFTLEKDMLSPLYVPFLIMFILLLSGFIAGIEIWVDNPLLRGTIYITFFWNTFNLCIIICCLGAVWERKQLRSAHRIYVSEPVVFNGVPATLTSLSLTGIRVATPEQQLVKDNIYKFKAPYLEANVQVVRVIPGEIMATFTPETNKKDLVNYVYGDSNRWKQLIENVLDGHTSYAGLSWQLFLSGLKACGITLKNIVLRIPFFKVCILFALLPASSAIAETYSSSISDLLLNDDYTVTSSQGMLHIPVYISPRVNINESTLKIIYRRSPNFTDTLPCPLSIMMDMEETLSHNVYQLEGQNMMAAEFLLPQDKLLPGKKLLTIMVRQALPEAKNEDENKQYKQMAAEGKFWTTLDLRASKLQADYVYRQLTEAESTDINFLFNDQSMGIKQLHFIIPQLEDKYISRAMDAARRISIMIGERPLAVSASAEIKNDRDCIIIADNPDELRKSFVHNPYYVLLTENNIPKVPENKLPIMRSNTTKSLRNLGMGNITFSPGDVSATRRFLVPSSAALLPNRYMVISFNLAYSPGLDKSSRLDICVNKETLTRIRLNRPEGNHTTNYRVEVPSKLLDKGYNKLILKPFLYPESGNRWDDDQDLSLTVFSSSNFYLPDTGIFTRIPELSALLSDGYPLTQNSNFYLQTNNYETAAAMLEFAALLAPYMQQNIAFADYSIQGSADQSNMVVFSQDESLPPDVLQLEALLQGPEKNFVRLNISARSENELQTGIRALWNPELVKKITGTKARLYYKSGKIILLPGESHIVSNFKPLNALAYLSNNYPLTTWSCISILILLFAFCGYIMAKKAE